MNEGANLADGSFKISGNMLLGGLGPNWGA